MKCAVVRTIRLGALLLIPGLLIGPSALADDPAWTVEASLLGGHHDNFFFRGPGAADPASDLVQVGVDGERTWDRGNVEITLLGDLSGTFVLDIDEADYQAGGVGVEIKRGATKAALGYHRTDNRLFSESGERVFFDSDGVEAWVRQSLTPRWWIRGEIALDRWDFDPAENDRDADILDFGLTARYAASDRLGIRGSLLWEERDAEAPDQNRDSTGFALALEGQPRDDIDLFFRWRQREREYSDAPAEARNFGREDTVNDFVFNLRWQLDRQLALLLQNEYRDGESTRPDRNYDGLKILAGVAYRWSGGIL